MLGETRSSTCAAGRHARASRNAHVLGAGAPERTCHFWSDGSLHHNNRTWTQHCHSQRSSGRHCTATQGAHSKRGETRSSTSAAWPVARASRTAPTLGAGAPERRCYLRSARSQYHILQNRTCRPLLSCNQCLPSSGRHTATQGAHRRHGELSRLAAARAQQGVMHVQATAPMCWGLAHRSARATLGPMVACTTMIARAGPFAAPVVHAVGSTLRSRERTRVCGWCMQPGD